MPDLRAVRVELLTLSRRARGTSARRDLAHQLGPTPKSGGSGGAENHANIEAPIPPTLAATVELNDPADIPLFTPTPHSARVSSPLDAPAPPTQNPAIVSQPLAPAEVAWEEESEEVATEPQLSLPVAQAPDQVPTEPRTLDIGATEQDLAPRKTSPIVKVAPYFAAALIVAFVGYLLTVVF